MKKDAEKRSRQTSRFKMKQGRSPNPKDLERRDNYSLISFLEQRLLETANILRQRSTGQAGFLFYNAYVRVKGDSWPTDDELIENPSMYGWKRVTWSNFTKIRTSIHGAMPGTLLRIDGKDYRVAAPTTSIISVEDHDPGEKDDYIYSTGELPKTPEDMLIEHQESKTKKMTINGVTCNISLAERLSLLLDLYEKRTSEKKLKILLRFEKWIKRRKYMFTSKEFDQHIKCIKNMISSTKNSVRKSKNEDYLSRDKRLGK